MKKAHIFTTVIFVFILAGISLGEIYDKAGNSSAQFLKMIPGGRASSMGNAVTSLGGTIESLFYNPAGMAELENNEIGAYYSKLVADSYYSSVILGMRIKEFGSVGIGFAGQFYGDIPIVELTSDGKLSDSEKMTSASDMSFFLSYATKLSEKIYTGVNVKLIQQYLENEQATSIAFDIGGKLLLLNNKLEVGLAGQNLGPGTKFVNERYDLPLTIKLGANYKVYQKGKHQALVAADGIRSLDDDFKGNFGLEYGYDRMVFIRAGYQLGYDLANYSLGWGLLMPIHDLYLRIDYGFAPYGDLGATHNIGLVFGLK